jgi:hypothetical protein
MRVSMHKYIECPHALDCIQGRERARATYECVRVCASPDEYIDHPHAPDLIEERRRSTDRVDSRCWSV